jgi:hypothetical protein
MFAGLLRKAAWLSAQANWGTTQFLVLRERHRPTARYRQQFLLKVELLVRISNFIYGISSHVRFHLWIL